MSLNDFRFIVFFMPLFLLLLFIQLFRKKIDKLDRVQLLILLVFSYFFISYNDLRFGICLVVVTLISYLTGLFIDKNFHKKIFFCLGTVFCVVILGYFKYCNFFINSFNRILGIESVSIDIVLPIGISFYIFTALSYIIDVYKGKYKAEYNFLNIALFISFFPKVTAGPITRLDEFMPQLKSYKGLQLDGFEAGIQIFTLGLFKKIVLANHLSVFVDDVFFSPSAYNTITVFLAVISYSLQIYFDFSGYSDMAIGISRILGFDLPRNFNLPYMAETPSDFWNRWHISLSSWLRDYIYIPLGGNRGGKLKSYFNSIIVMLVSGLWHGAGWTFIVWGFLHGIVNCVHKILNDLKLYKDKKSSCVIRCCKIVLMFSVVSLLWVVFRATDIDNAVSVYKSLFTIHTGISQPYSWTFFALFCLLLSTACVIFKKKSKNDTNGYYLILDLSKISSLIVFFVFVGLTIIMGYYGNTAFIYGKF